MNDIDINLDAQPVDAAAEVSAAVPVSTFIILKDTLLSAGGITAPVFRSYVDAPQNVGPYADIDPESYSAPRAVLDAYLNIEQPDDLAGAWWVGKLPADDEDAKYSYRGSVLTLERFNVAYVISINND